MLEPTNGVVDNLVAFVSMGDFLHIGELFQLNSLAGAAMVVHVLSLVYIMVSMCRHYKWYVEDPTASKVRIHIIQHLVIFGAMLISVTVAFLTVYHGYTDFIRTVWLEDKMYIPILVGSVSYVYTARHLNREIQEDRVYKQSVRVLIEENEKLTQEVVRLKEKTQERDEFIRINQCGEDMWLASVFGNFLKTNVRGRPDK